MAPNTSRFLAGALNPPERGKFRARDLEALNEVRALDELLPTLNEREPVKLPAPGHRLDNRPKVDLGEPLDPKKLEAIATRYEVWEFSGRRSKLRSVHRVGPKSLFGLKWSERPSEYQRDVADDESKRCAQRAAYEAFLAGATRVSIKTYRRKEATSRFKAGLVISDVVRTMDGKDHGTSALDSWILGEPSEEALLIDAKYSV